MSVVVADVAGASALAERLDPESMHQLLDRYADACGAVIERHGGSVEGYAGDAVVGVFGQAQVHEDDALRAVRAAVEMRAAGAELELALKLGVDAGEVFVGAGARRSRFAAGSRSRSPPGSRTPPRTARSCSAAPCSGWSVTPCRPSRSTARGGSLGLRADATRPRRARSSAGTRELGELRDAFAAVEAEQECRAVTVVGPAGIGKSRLARELIGAIGDATRPCSSAAARPTATASPTARSPRS